MNSFCTRHGWSHPTTQPTVPRPRRPPRSNRTMSVQGTKRSVSMPQWTLRLPREPTNATHGSRTPHTLPLPYSEGESTQPLSRRDARQGVNASVLQSMTRTGFMGCSTATSPRMSSAPSSAALCSGRLLYAWNGKSRWLAFEQLLSARTYENRKLPIEFCLAEVKFGRILPPF